MQVLVVGAGPTGLTGAVELVRLGMIPKIIDKKPKRSSLSRAVGILPNSLRLLNASGVSTKLIEAGIKIDKINVYNHSRLLANISLKNSQSDYPYVLALAQDKTEQILESALIELGGRVEYGQTLTNLTQSPNGVIAELSGGHSQQFDTVLAADGVNSRARQSMGLDFPGYELNEIWSIADVDAQDWRHPGEFTLIRFGEGHIAVVVPLESSRYRLVSNTPDVLTDLPIKINVSHIRRQGRFNIAIRQVLNYHTGNVYLAGDAAHCHSPVGGRGMNLGIADAVNFARRFNDNTLDQYSICRHDQGASAIKASERFRNVMTSNNWLSSALVNHGLGLIGYVPALQSRFAKNILDE